MDNLNSFQKWASDYARAFGWIVVPYGNWVILDDGDVRYEAMSAERVQEICQSRGVKA